MKSKLFSTSFVLFALSISTISAAGAQERMLIFCSGQKYNAVIEFPRCLMKSGNGPYVGYSNGFFFTKDGRLHRDIPLTGSFRQPGVLSLRGEDTAMEIHSATLTPYAPRGSAHKGQGSIGIDISDTFSECTISVGPGDMPIPFCYQPN